MSTCGVLPFGRWLFEAVTDAFTKKSEQQVDSTMALTICENMLTALCLYTCTRELLIHFWGMSHAHYLLAYIYMRAPSAECFIGQRVMRAAGRDPGLQPVPV